MQHEVKKNLNPAAKRNCMKEWITSIIENARAEGIPLFTKGNAGWEEKMQEYPER